MRISRKRRPQKALVPVFKSNETIDSPEVRLIDSNGEHLGVFPIREALRMAEEQEKDLVEINPKGVPPVAQIIEYSHFKYQKEKEMRKQKANTHVSDTKGIRLSIRISEHDMEVRRDQAAKFLDRGDKVKIEIILRGREHARVDLANSTIKKFINMTETIVSVRTEQEITKQGNKVTAVIAKR